MTRVLVIGALAGAIGCTDLPPIDVGVCGNFVVDPGEDCDTYASEPDSRCAAPGETTQCRYDCAPRTDGPTPRCPAGMQCGGDGLCRTPSGAFVALAEAPLASPREVAAADVDDDGRDDLVAVVGESMSVHVLDEDGLSTTFSSPIPSRGEPIPVVADLSTDGRDDLLLPIAAGLLVALGDDTRAPAPTAYPTLLVPPAVTDLVVAAVEVLPQVPGAESMMAGTLNGVSGLAYIDPQTLEIGFLAAFTGVTLADLAGDIAVADFDDPGGGAAPCQELALGFRGASELLVYTPCRLDGAGEVVWNAFGAPRSLGLPAGATLEAGPLLHDVDGDGRRDLVVGASRCQGCASVHVAYAVGDGSFGSEPPQEPPVAGDDAFSTSELLDTPLPLAIGDLDGNEVLDFATPDGVLVGSANAKGEPVYFLSAQSGAAPWTEAVIADLNGDGRADVLAGSSEAPVLQFWGGTGDGFLNAWDLPVLTPVAHLTTGDFDGDLVLDVVLAELSDPAEEQGLGDSVSVLFGSPFGAPRPPESLGRLGSLRQLIAARAATIDGVDGITDIVSVSRAPDGTFQLGGFVGRTDRLLRSPFATSRTDPQTPLPAVYCPERLVVGRFSDDDHADVATVAEWLAPEGVPTDRRAWVVPSLGEARFDNAGVRGSEPVAPDLDWARSLAGAVDLDGDARDELVVLLPTTADPPAGRLVVGRLHDVDGALGWVFGEAAPTEDLFARVETSGGAPAPNARMRVVDLDGDGRRDVIASAAARVVVYWNDGSGDLAATSAIAASDGAPVADFVVLHAGGDARLDLALLAAGRVQLAHLDSARALRHGAIALDAGEAARLLAAADADGDGIEDLVVAGDGGMTLFRGLPVLP